MTSMAPSLTTELGLLQGLLFEVEPLAPRSLEDLWEPNQPPHPVSESLAQHRPWDPMVNMQNQVTFAQGAKLQIIGVQSLMSASGKPQDKSHHPRIPILSFSPAGLKAWGGSTQVAGQCHQTTVSPVWWLRKVGRKSRNSQRTGCSSELGREEGRIPGEALAITYVKASAKSRPRASPRELPIQLLDLCHRSKEHTQPYWSVQVPIHPSPSTLHFTGVPLWKKCSGERKWCAVFPFT